MCIAKLFANSTHKVHTKCTTVWMAIDQPFLSLSIGPQASKITNLKAAKQCSRQRGVFVFHITVQVTFEFPRSTSGGVFAFLSCPSLISNQLHLHHHQRITYHTDTIQARRTSKDLILCSRLSVHCRPSTLKPAAYHLPTAAIFLLPIIDSVLYR